MDFTIKLCNKNQMSKMSETILRMHLLYYKQQFESLDDDKEAERYIKAYRTGSKLLEDMIFAKKFGGGNI